MDHAVSGSHLPIYKRSAVTLICLFVYTLGTWVPVAGVHQAVMLNSSYTLFALGLTPILDALLLGEVLKFLPPVQKSLLKTPANASRLTSILLAAGMALAAYSAVRKAAHFADPIGDVEQGSLLELAAAAASWTAGPALLLWIAHAITRHGLGNGFWILLAVPCTYVLSDTYATVSENLGFGFIHTRMLETPVIIDLAAIVVLVGVHRGLPHIASASGIALPFAFAEAARHYAAAFTYGPPQLVQALTPGTPSNIGLEAALVFAFYVLRTGANPQTRSVTLLTVVGVGLALAVTSLAVDCAAAATRIPNDVNSNVVVLLTVAALSVMQSLRKPSSPD